MSKKFVDLIEQLSAHTAHPDTLSYTTRFIGRLRADIHSIVLVQCFVDLNVACKLTLLHEEAVELTRRKEFKRSDTSPFIKPVPACGSLLLPLPPQRLGLGAPPLDDKSPPKDRRPETCRPLVDDKLQSLRSYRKARGLCTHYSEKWHLGHKCAPVLQLHTLQEVWDL